MQTSFRAISFAAAFLLTGLLTSPLYAQAHTAGAPSGKPIGRIYFGGADNSGSTTGTKERVLHGRVLDKNGAAVKGALVYLKETKTSTMKSILTDDEGGYRFVQLSQNLDYELWAQADAKKSEQKTVSSFDNRQELIFNLRFSDPPKAEASQPATKPTAAKP